MIGILWDQLEETNYSLICIAQSVANNKLTKIIGTLAEETHYGCDNFCRRMNIKNSMRVNLACYVIPNLAEFKKHIIFANYQAHAYRRKQTKSLTTQIFLAGEK